MIRQEINKKYGAAVRFTHDERILGLADSIYCLEQGKLIKV